MSALSNELAGAYGGQVSFELFSNIGSDGKLDLSRVHPTTLSLVKAFAEFATRVDQETGNMGAGYREVRRTESSR